MAGTVGRAVMGTAEWDREFIARFTTKRARLRELQVMGIGGLAGAQEAGLLGNVPEVLLVAVAAWGAQREHALVDRVASCPSALRLTPGRLCGGSCSRSSCCSQEPPNSQRDDAQYAVYSKACLAALADCMASCRKETAPTSGTPN
jgi:hypothetical protein